VLFDFQDKIALITGAGRGIGQAAALAFAEHGASVALLDIDEQLVEQTCEHIRGAGGTAHAWQCDVSDEKQVLETVDAVIERFGRIDVLFNNAGINRRIPLMDWTDDDYNAVIGTNLIGALLVARAVGRHMIDRRSGSIVNMSALGGGVIGLGRGTAVYCATKGAVAAMTRDLAAEWAPHGVRVNAVAPGWIKTEMNAPLLKHETAAERVVDRVPLGRWGEPDDVVGPVLFLASDTARYVTGHLLPIDGGAAAIIKLTSDEVIR
jgi:NAD(P)-dependent dehydrogenase (short-subunit alcohol dehydrogenase family)